MHMSLQFDCEILNEYTLQQHIMHERRFNTKTIIAHNQMVVLTRTID